MILIINVPRHTVAVCQTVKLSALCTHSPSHCTTALAHDVHAIHAVTHLKKGCTSRYGCYTACFSTPSNRCCPSQNISFHSSVYAHLSTSIPLVTVSAISNSVLCRRRPCLHITAVPSPSLALLLFSLLDMTETATAPTQEASSSTTTPAHARPPADTHAPTGLTQMHITPHHHKPRIPPTTIHTTLQPTTRPRGLAWKKDEMSVEHYVKDPSVTPANELVTEILVPVA